MKLLTHIQPLTDAITPVRRGAADFNSNFFANNQQVESWIGRSALFYESGPLGVLVFRRDREFYRVYHVAANPEALSKQLASLDQIPTGSTDFANTLACFEWFVSAIPGMPSALRIPR
jgi:hypothetical protein